MASVTTQPIPIMFNVQKVLFIASAVPVIGVVPAALKTVVSLIENLVATVFLGFYKVIDMTLCDSKFIKHEIQACEEHCWLAFFSMYQGLFAMCMLGIYTSELSLLEPYEGNRSFVPMQRNRAL